MGFHDWHGSGFGEVITFWLGREPDITNTDQDMTMQKIKSFTFSVVLAGVVLSPVQSLRAAEGDGKELNYQPFTLSLDASTLGLGASVRWRFSDHFGIAGGGDYFGYSRDGDDIEGVSYNSKLRLFSLPVSLDVYPWQHRSFRISIGALINQNRLSAISPVPLDANGVPDATVFIPIGNSGPGGINAVAIGGLSLKVEQQTFSPFVSVGGDFELIERKSFALALGLELGVAYTGNPKVTLLNGNRGAAANVDAQVDIERQQIEDKMKDYKFYPIVKVSLNFSF